MSTSLAELTAEQLRAQTLEWLQENLPAGWIEAIDAGDTEKAAKVRAGLDLDAWYVLMGEAGYATPTWPAEYGAGLSLTPCGMSAPSPLPSPPGRATTDLLRELAVGHGTP